MKPYEVAMFKKFLENMGVDTVYINMYRKNKVIGNPESLEKFLYTTPTNEVCTKAFYFIANSDYGYDYWTNAGKKFLEYVTDEWDEDHANDWWRMRGSRRKLLKKNYDAIEFWKYESRTAARQRIAEMMPEYACLLEDEKEKGKDVLDSIVIPEKSESIIVAGKKHEEKKDFLSEFEFVGMDKPTARLKRDEVRVNTRNRRWNICINKDETDKIRNIGRFKCVALMKRKDGQLALFFNNINGCNVSDNERDANININSKELVTSIKSHLEEKSNFFVLKIKEIAHTDEYIAYLLSK